MGLASGVMGIFAATQQKRAADTAMRFLVEAQNMAYDESGKLKTTFDPILKESVAKLGMSWDTVQQMITDTRSIDTGAPLNASDKIALEDAQRMMNENLAKTGNLRSGAAGYSNAELTRRVLADAMTRNFDREMQKSQLLFGGAQMLTGIAGTEANMGMQGEAMAEDMFKTGLSFAPMRASMELQKGAANANQLMAIGDLGDSIISTAASAYMGGAGGLTGSMGIASGMGGAMQGAAMGLSPQMSSMMMMSNYFGGMKNTQPQATKTAFDSPNNYYAG